MKLPWQRKVINPKVKFELVTLHRTSSYLSTAYTNTLKSCLYLILKWILGNRITFGQWNTWLMSVNNPITQTTFWGGLGCVWLCIFGSPHSDWSWYGPNKDATGSRSTIQDSFLLMFIVEACNWKIEIEQREWDWSASETKTLQCLNVFQPNTWCLMASTPTAHNACLTWEGKWRWQQQNLNKSDQLISFQDVTGHLLLSTCNLILEN